MIEIALFNLWGMVIAGTLFGFILAMGIWKPKVKKE